MEEEIPDNLLFEWYERYIGEPQTKTDVYLGFGLFLGGIALGILSLLIFLPSTGVEAETSLYWGLRETAISMAAIGLPTLMLGMVVLLPARERAVYAAAVGTVICTVGVVFFISTYPSSFNVKQSVTAQVISVYAIGLAVVVSSTGAALIAHHLERAKPETEIKKEEDSDTEPSVSDEQVKSDIEEAMKSSDISWGGVKKTETKRLSINTDDVKMDKSGMNIQPETTRSSGASVEEAVSGLKNLKGGKKKESKGSDVNQQTEALKNLRNQKSSGNGGSVEEQRTENESLIGNVRKFLDF